MPAEHVVHLVEDPEDSWELVALVNALANRMAGRVVLHPTPGLAGPVPLASDLLVSMGKRFDALTFERVRRRAWELVDTWVVAERVRHLFVLRAHLLAPQRWREILELTGRHGLEVWFVVHPHTPVPIETLLPGSCRRWEVSSFADRWREVAEGGDDDAQDADLPEVPADDFFTFRAACRRLLDSASFERVDRTFCESMDNTDAALCAWKPRLRQPPPPELELADVAVQLQALVVGCSGPAEALVRLRGAQAAYFRAGWLLRFEPPVVPSPTGLAPLGPRLDPAIAARLRRLCLPRSTTAMALFLAGDLRSLGLSRLDIGDIDDDGAAFVIGRRRFAVPDYARSLVRAQLVERRGAGASDSDPLFVHARTGERSSPSALRNVLRSVSAKTAIAVGVWDSLASPHDGAGWLREQGLRLSRLCPVPGLGR